MLKACQACCQILQGFVKVDRKKRKIFNFARLKFILRMLKKIFITIGQYLLFMKQVFRKPEKWRIFWRQLVTESDKLIISSILLVGVISVFIGGVLVIQMASNLESPLIDKMYIGYMVRESLVLEFCSTMVALILAGKMGSNISSEIGSMRITEQIDAMEIMGVNSANYLILPKIVAFMVMMPLLVTLSMFTGLLGGYGISAITNVLPVSEYLLGIQYAFIPFYVWYSFIKTIIFAFIIASMASYYGYYAKGGALEVGKASTKAVVNSSIVVLLMDVVLTNLMLN